MTYNKDLAKLGQYVSVNATSNVVSINSQLTIGSVTINSTSVSGGTALTANNASYLGGTIASGYQTIAGLNANVAALSYVNTSGVYTITGVYTYTANLVINTAIVAGGTSGNAGQVLTSNGSANVYWSTPASGGAKFYYFGSLQ